ncbi:MAG: hypothetical protein M3P11_13740 [Actinomycetota bacterium]|nr:hypothetical protein [Actinomycetota bacterium]
MGEGTSDAWHRIQLQLDVVETCAHGLDPRVYARIVALRRQANARCGLQPNRESAVGENEAAGLSEIVQEVQEVVRHLREILAVQGAALTSGADDHTGGPDALGAEVARRRRVLVENAEKLFRVSNSMRDVLRSVK